MIRLSLLILVLGTIGCKNSKGTHEKVNTLDKVQRIKLWKDSTSFVELPYTADFGSQIKNTYQLHGEDFSKFKGDFPGGDIHILGLLPDTINFYGVIFEVIGSVGNFGIATFDKSGKLIDTEKLTDNNCVISSGQVLHCTERTTIGTDLSLDYYFKSIIAGEGLSTDTVYTCRVNKGQITKAGAIDFMETKDVDCKD